LFERFVYDDVGSISDSRNRVSKRRLAKKEWPVAMEEEESGKVGNRLRDDVCDGGMSDVDGGFGE
jgi:hypothetical protein